MTMTTTTTTTTTTKTTNTNNPNNPTNSGFLSSSEDEKDNNVVNNSLPWTCTQLASVEKKGEVEVKEKEEVEEAEEGETTEEEVEEEEDEVEEEEDERDGDEKENEGDKEQTTTNEEEGEEDNNDDKDGEEEGEEDNNDDNDDNDGEEEGDIGNINANKLTNTQLFNLLNGNHSEKLKPCVISQKVPPEIIWPLLLSQQMNRLVMPGDQEGHVVQTGDVLRLFSPDRATFAYWRVKNSTTVTKGMKDIVEADNVLTVPEVKKKKKQRLFFS